jgi:hypothetical protein
MTLNQCKVSRLVGALMAAYAVGPVYATIAQDPLLSRTAAVEPNIVFVFDDSGSMPATAIYQYGGVASGMGMTGPNNDAVFDSNGISPVWTTLPTTFHGRSPDVNLIYYDPRVTYSRRINADGTFKAAGSTSGVSAFNVYFYKPAASSTYGVSSVNVTAKGSGYPASGVTASFPAPPSGGVRATASVQLSSSQNVASVTVANGGGGYDTGVLATFSAPPAGGVRATGSVSLANHGNKVSTVNVIQNGSGYPSSGVVATFSAPPAGGIQATGTVVLAQSQQVNFVTVTDGGSYNSNAQATFSAPDLPGGVRARGTVVLLGRSIVSIIITNPGSGYTSPPSLSISNRRGGGGNTAQFNINMGSLGNVVTGFNITNPGSGYTSTPSINLSGTGLGSGAQFSVNTATSRRIGGITISNGGSGYTSAPTITLSNAGAGVGAALTVNTSATNVISGITITNPGSGYSAQPQLTLAGTRRRQRRDLWVWLHHVSRRSHQYALGRHRHAHDSFQLFHPLLHTRWWQPIGRWGHRTQLPQHRQLQHLGLPEVQKPHRLRRIVLQLVSRAAKLRQLVHLSPHPHGAVQNRDRAGFSAAQSHFPPGLGHHQYAG